MYADVRSTFSAALTRSRDSLGKMKQLGGVRTAGASISTEGLHRLGSSGCSDGTDDVVFVAAAVVGRDASWTTDGPDSGGLECRIRDLPRLCRPRSFWPNF